MRAVLRLVWAFVRRDVTVARSYRFPFALQLVGSAGILLVVFQVSRLVDPGLSDDPTLRAGYFPYVLVGMAVLAIVHSALQSFGAKLREEQVTGTFEALLTTPASPSVLALSLAAYELLQALVSGLVLLGAGAALGARYDLGPLPLLASLVCLAGLVALAAAAGIAVAAFGVVFKRGGTVATLASALLALFGGIYFPVAQLPGPLRAVAELVPFTFGISAFRASLLLGEVRVLPLLALVVSGAVALGLALAVFRRAVDRARRQGSLTHY